VLVFALAFAAVVARPGTAHACDCGAFDPLVAFADADAVFTGESIEVRVGPEGEPTEAQRRHVFSVDQVFKGEVFEQQSVVSSTEESECGLPWEQPGAIAIVFGFRQGADTLVDGELVAERCTTTALTAASVLPEFGEPFAPLPGASPIGIAPPPPPVGGDVHLSWEWFAVAVLAAAGIAAGIVPSRRPRPSA
jgi:hypothetical protein